VPVAAGSAPESATAGAVRSLETWNCFEAALPARSIACTRNVRMPSGCVAASNENVCWASAQLSPEHVLVHSFRSVQAPAASWMKTCALATPARRSALVAGAATPSVAETVNGYEEAPIACSDGPPTRAS
jgi:hypothetical protein